MEYLGKSEIWDFEVPVTHNYFIGGIVNHNSGKSEGGGMAVARVAEEVSDSRILCATIETKISINVQQNKLKDWLTKDNILDGDYNPKRGWKNAIVEGTNGYSILFKTYAQGFEAFQGDNFDLVWLDEECPYDIFQECLMRTADRNGAMLFTFTSLQGFTRLVNRLWESNDPEVYTTLLDLYMNPYIATESKDLIKNTIDPDEVDSRIHGKPHLKEGLIYKEFGNIHKVDRFDYTELVRTNPNRWQLHEGIDPHTRTPHHWCSFLFDRANNVLYVVEALKAPKESMLIEDFARLIKAKRARSRGKVLMPTYCQIDTSSMTPEVTHIQGDEDQEDIHTVRLSFFKAGIQTILCTKDNSVGINAVKTRLKVVRQNGEVKRNPRLYVFNDLTDVNWEFMRYSWGAFSNSKVSESKEMINKPQKKSDHFMDIIKYECIKIQLDTPHDRIYPDEILRYPDMNY
jgi:phage terminase large subunit-like protein